MSTKTQAVHTQFVVGPVQQVRRADKLLYFPDLEQIGGATIALAGFRRMIDDGADFEALQHAFGSSPEARAGLLDAVEVGNALPVLAATLDDLDAARWTPAIERLKAAGPDLKTLFAAVEVIHRTILANLLGAPNTTAAELGLRLLKAAWLAEVVALPARIEAAGVELTLESFADKYWTSGGPILAVRLPRSQHSPWPTPPLEGDSHAQEDTGQAAARERIARLTAATVELEGARRG